ncbi:MAG: DUF4249 domain-containing protein [Bacteroidota bacterium]
MKGQSVYTVILMSLMTLFGCIQPFEVDFPENDRILVISGVLTNVDREHYVNISYTNSFSDEFEEPILINAEVFVEDQSGNIYTYVQESNGRYISPVGFKAEIGNTYQLKVLLNEQLFASDPEVLLTPTEIDNLHWDPKEVIDPDINEVVRGAQFFIDSKESQNKYFRYEWEGTHIIRPPYYATNEVIDGEIFTIGHVTGPCYTTNYSNSLLLASSIGLSQTRVLDVPINFIAEDDSKLRHAYSLLVRQYSLSESTYNYYKQLKKNNESSGSFFDAQQGSIPGNIVNVDDPESIVLGFFEVSGENSKRKKFTRTDDFGDRLAMPAFPFFCGEIVVCDEDTGECFDATDNISPSQAIQYITEGYADYITFLDTISRPQLASIQRRGCSDCSYYATTEIPDFWDE